MPWLRRQPKSCLSRGRAEKQGFNITLERSLDPGAGEADVFLREITRALLNLISNGFYAATKRKARNEWRRLRAYPRKEPGRLGSATTAPGFRPMEMNGSLIRSSRRSPPEKGTGLGQGKRSHAIAAGELDASRVRVLT
jgi:hypothetical protein